MIYYKKAVRRMYKSSLCITRAADTGRHETVTTLDVEQLFTDKYPIVQRPVYY